MKAVHVTEFGAPDVLTLVDLPDPTPGPGQIAIDVTHAAVGLIDLYIRQGLYRDRPGLPQPPYVPGLEVAGTVRALGEGVTGYTVGEKVVALSTDATGGLASAFPGIARQLGASRIVGTVRSGKAGIAAAIKLPYDTIVDSAHLSGALGEEKFDIIIDPVGGPVRTQSLELLAPSGRLLLVGNASGDWNHQIPSNALWYGNITVSGFNSGAYLPAHPETLSPAADAALKSLAAGLADTDLDILPLADAATAHQRLENHTVNGRIILTP